MNHYLPFYRRLQDLAHTSFPSLSEIPEPNWTYLLSPYQIELPQKIYEQAAQGIAALFSLSRTSSYRQKLAMTATAPAEQASVLMAYDFHTTPTGEPRLVEINTNASSFLLAGLLNALNTDNEVLKNPWMQQLRASFENEAGGPSPKHVAIVDDDPKTQKMYLEFLMYRDLFQTWGWTSEIGDAKDLQLLGKALTLGRDKIDFVYNRSTDFYLTQEIHQNLATAWRERHAVVSPQPDEYFLLADKERLIDFARPGWLVEAGASPAQAETIQSILIPTFDKSAFASPEEIWTKRRSLFFKPKRAHGGKSAYRGESVSKKVFGRLLTEDIVIQEYVPAAAYPCQDPNDPMSHWKFDVRFYVYREQIQQVIARLYQGQVTNFATPLGGFAVVRFV